MQKSRSDIQKHLEPGDFIGPAERISQINQQEERMTGTNPGGYAEPQPEFESTSDRRTVNNVLRHAYRELSAEEKAAMQALKDKGLEFYNLLHSIGATDPAGDRLGSRELALAATKLEEAVMWGVKHITR